MTDTTEEAVQFARLNKDLQQAAVVLSASQARYLVDLYYTVQNYRIRSANQIRAMNEAGEPNAVIEWMLSNQKAMEADIRKVMDTYSSVSEVGRWSKSICGIGPIIAAGLLAHIDIHQAPTVGHIWSFAGLNPKSRWAGTKEAEKVVGTMVAKAHRGGIEESIATLCAETMNQKPASVIQRATGENGKISRKDLISVLAKRPWNARLKVLCWKIGESFVKVKGREDDVYGKLYDERKEAEAKANERGEYEEQAAEKLERFNIGKTTEAWKWYSVGKLPPGHLHSRAKRYAVKLFLAHWHRVAFESEFKKSPPLPWVIEHGGHAHLINPPNWGVEV